jgi:4-alpha-glucanotransferase
MQADGFKWWLARMRTQNALFDMVRIDHFRGLEAAWEIPADEPTAINGAWELAPGDALLDAIIKHLPLITLVAEDLGIITDEVNALREKYDLPGMKILQFAFDGSDENPYLPEKITENSVVYTGTHDNDTSLGWYDGLNEDQKSVFHRYLNEHGYVEGDDVEMPLVLIDMALASNATLAIIPMQDILKLGSADRMNTPGTIEGNWQWRFNWMQLDDAMAQALEHSILQNKRNPNTLRG